MILTLQLWKRLLITALVLAPAVICLPVLAQNSRTISGVVLDARKASITGASVQVKTTNISTSTDQNGRFTISVPAGKNFLLVSHVGKITQQIDIRNKQTIVVTFADSTALLEDVVVVGYGKQKKASVVGAISQVTGKVLERTGGVTNLGMALTGNLPGLITSASTGMPGAEDPQIIIRGQSSWTNSSPLILVDGIERPGALGTIDIASVASISILKDASATAVYGVKGANGVILIATKQGVAGKANIQIRSNVTSKVASKLPEKYDSYDALMIKNRAIERELMISANGWAAYKPQQIIDKYRNPTTTEEWDRYVNVDWVEELFKDNAMSYSTAANVSGGSKFVTYFAGVDFISEGDLFKTFQNGRGYQSGYGYNRTNFRSNLDFNLTKTTKFSTKLFGSNAVRKVPWNAADNNQSYWASAYRTSPDAMRPIYSDGTWGFFQPRNADVPNSVYSLAMSGVEKRTTTQLTTDFVLQQQLDMITKGLSVRASLSLDNTFREKGRGINDLYNSAQRKWVDPETGTIFLEQPINSGTQLDYSDGVRWSNQAGIVDTGATYRRQNYMAQINYSRKFGKHDVSGLGLVQREKVATGNEWPRFREDWVYRVTYNYDSRYFIESSGAYNGSEKFGPDFRFKYFPSVSGGWTITNEQFMKSVSFLNLLKLRASWGRVGDDGGDKAQRFLFLDIWRYGGNTQMGSPPANTPYSFYGINALGNPNISWETSEKRNLGIEYGFLNGKITGSVDVFNDNRTDIVVVGGERAIPSYFGATAPSANLGRVTSKGYEIEVNLNHSFNNGIRVWANTNMTHATNNTIFRDDPELRLAYQKAAGYPIGQTRTYLNEGYLASWDDMYGSTQRSTNNQNKLPGDYNIIDFNGDGVIDGNDTAPVGYTGTPQNTYNATLGLEWKGISLFVQFYGANNVTREVAFPTFHSSSNVAYVEGTYWSKENGGGDVPLPRWGNLEGGGGTGTRYLYDGSYVRLKNAEIGYNLPGILINKLGMKTCRLYLNGNNLLLWTKMPDDRESNFSGGSSFGAYPTMKRFNLGIDITL